MIKFLHNTVIVECGFFKNDVLQVSKWIFILVFDSQMVKPKQKRVEEAKEALNLAQDGLRVKQESLSKVRLRWCFLIFFVHTLIF